MSDRNAGEGGRRRDPAALLLRLLATFGETRREDIEAISVAEFIRLTKFAGEADKTGLNTEPKELKVTWLKEPEKPDSEE